MNFAFKKQTCRVLAVSLFALSMQTAQAGLISADQAAAPTASAERTLVLNTLSRADVAAQLQATGVDPLAARDRVNTMTDQEVRTLAQDIQAAPAGADAWGVVAVLVIAGLVWYYVIRR